VRCTSPRTVGFLADGKTICWSPKNYSKEYATFQLPCGKCIECRLDYSRQWAIRCIHEAQMYENNCFVTLTYKEPCNPKLDYTDFQKFMKKLRKTQNEPIGMFVTGEYGEKTKRPHWHAIIFNWSPRDAEYKYSNDRGDRVYSSATLENIWGHGITEFGSVTFESAGYCARYAAKKLVHGKDNEHEYQPISKKSSKHAIGKKWLERFYTDVFAFGRLLLSDGTESGIPRYYEKWLKKEKPEEWEEYTKNVKTAKMMAAEEKNKAELDAYWANVYSRKKYQTKPMTPNEIKHYIQLKQFKELQGYLKL